MELITKDEFETSRANGMNLAIVHDNVTQKNYYIRVNEEDKRLKEQKDIVHFVEENCFIKINNSTVLNYWS